jgi:hypothetical protein
MAFERVEGPLGPRRLDYVAAQICCTLVSLYTPRGKKRPKIDDFLVQWGKGGKGQRGGGFTKVEDQLNVFRALAALTAATKGKRTARKPPAETPARPRVPNRRPPAR